MPPSRNFPLQQMDDPLSLAILPPVNETPQQKQRREMEEAVSKAVSDKIDEAIKAEKEKEDSKKHKPVRVLLVGQSESGKSTTLKNFQLMYTPNALREELSCWRTIIHLNIVRSIRLIIETLDTFVEASPQPVPSSCSGSRTSTSTISDHSDVDSLGPYQLTLLMRLRPLLDVEATLIKRLGAPHETEAIRLRRRDPLPLGKIDMSEVHVRPNIWKKSLSSHPGKQTRLRSPVRQKAFGEDGDDSEEDDSIPNIMDASKETIDELWKDQVVQSILAKKRLRLEELPGFFLDDVLRTASLNYVPTDNDILKARIKTIGVTEHRFVLEEAAMAGPEQYGKEPGREWVIYDVGGTRTQRKSWIPFFQHVNAIIFLAPISAFDQRLVEDDSVGRLEDTIKLWKEICDSQLLTSVNIILFLNKCDVLASKLRRGIEFKRYVPSYKGRNEPEAVARYFKTYFTTVHKQSWSRHALRFPDASRPVRSLHMHFTSVTDFKATSQILHSVHYFLLRQNLKNALLL